MTYEKYLFAMAPREDTQDDCIYIRGTTMALHYEAWSYKKRSTKRITGYRKSV